MKLVAMVGSLSKEASKKKKRKEKGSYQHKEKTSLVQRERLDHQQCYQKRKDQI
jgi:hypothetical protein